MDTSDRGTPAGASASWLARLERLWPGLPAFVALALIPAAGALGAPLLVGWDDPYWTTLNPVVRDGWAGVWRTLHYPFDPQREQIFATVHWAPLTLCTMALEHLLCGAQCLAWWHRLWSIVPHGVCAWLVLRLGLRLTGKRGVALAAAGIFALHPVVCESICWIAARSNVHAQFFGLLALAVYARAVLPGPDAGAPLDWRRTLAAVLLLGCAHIGKSSAAAFWPALLGVDWLLFQDSWTRRLARWALLALPVALSLAVVRLSHSGLFLPPPGRPPFGPWLMSLEIWLRHLGLLAWPLNLSAFYLVSPAGPSWSCLASGSALVLLLAAAARWAQVPWKRIAFYLAWTAAAVLPVANPFVSISMVLQDRYAYLALPAFALLLAEVLTGIVLRPAAAPANGQPTPPGRLLRAAGAVVAAGLVLILAVLSATRSLAWRGELVLFEDAVQHQPGCAFGHAHLATNLFFASRNLSPEARAAVLTKALRHHELAAKCADFERLIYPLQLTDERAQILWQLGRRQESCALFRQVLEGRPERPAEAGAKLRALKFLAADAVESGRLAEGLALLEDGLRLAGQDPELLINRLEVWRRLGRWEDARAEAQRLLAHPEPQVRSKAMQVLRNSRL